MRRAHLLIIAVSLAGAACSDATAPSIQKMNAPSARPSLQVANSGGVLPSVSAGGWQTCVMRNNGSISCFGGNDSGESTIPAGLPSIVNMSAGLFTTCVAEQNGSAACWGDNYYGESSVPAGLSSVTQVTTGMYHSCALQSSGTIVCWGRDSEGELDVPAGLPAATQVSASGLRTCALVSGGAVICWGQNNYGESTTPAGLGAAVQLSAGRAHTCVLTTASAVRCWGNNDSGESTVPAGLGTSLQVSAGQSQHTCAVQTAGTVMCWGDDSFGESTPPAGLTGVVQVSAGLNYSCALTSANAVICWGSSSQGQSSVPAGLTLIVALPQTIAFTSIAPASASVGGTYTLGAIATSGLSVTFSSQSPTVCTVSGGVVTFVAVGTCTIAGDQAGAALTLPAPTVTQSFTVSAKSQVITFTSSAPNPAIAGATYTLAATATSGLPVTYTSQTPTVCSVSGSVVTFIGSGTCTIVANQPGNALFLAAPAQAQTIAIAVPSTKSQSITVKSPPSTGYDYGFDLLFATGGGSNRVSECPINSGASRASLAWLSAAL